MNLIIPKIFEANKAKPAEAMKDVQGVIKMIFLDMGFAIDTYIEAMNNRENAMKAEFVENLTSFVDSLNNSATSIAAATSQQSATVAEQASSVHEVTSTVAEVKQTSIQAAEHANNMVESASTAVEASKQGTKAVEDSIQGMHEIQKQVEAIADKILSLSEQRSEEHTSELQSRPHLVCRLLLEKKKSSRLLRTNTSCCTPTACRPGTSATSCILWRVRFA